MLAELGPALQLLAPGLIAGILVQQGMDAETAQTVAQEQAAAVLAALPSLVPEQLPGLTNSLGKLNLATQGFDPVTDANGRARHGVDHHPDPGAGVQGDPLR